MKEFKGKVAVITGAASGIGRALADRCVQEGMKAVLADVEVEALAKTEASLKASGATVLAVQTDVSQARDVAALAQKTLEVFGAVHLLCNNAGVGTEAAIWESTLEVWEWVMGVNLWGVIHGVHAFVPLMLAQDTECHIVNTASMAGLISGPGLGTYKVTKHAVVSLSETLHHELAERGKSQSLGALSGDRQHADHGVARNRPGYLPPTAPLGPASGRGGTPSASSYRLGCLRSKSPMPSSRPSGRTDSTSSRTRKGKSPFARGWKTSSRNVVRPLQGHDKEGPPGLGA